MTQRQPQLRFLSEEDTHRKTAIAAHTIAEEFGLKELFFTDFYTPSFNPKLIIFRFATQEEADSANNSPVIEQILRKAKCKRHDTIQSDSIKKSHKTIIISGLSAAHFFFVTRADGHHTDETLDQKMEQMFDNINQIIQTKRHTIIDHHFIRYNEYPPRVLKITFDTIDQAK